MARDVDLSSAFAPIPRPGDGAGLARRLGRGAAALREVSDLDLARAWGETVDAFLDPASPERRALDPDLVRSARLSPQGLAAGLAAVLGGVRREPAARLLARAAGLARPAPAATPALVILAGNLPALAVQPLLPALALRRPVLFKSSSAEPFFAPAFLAALARREPRLGEAVAAASWPGGEVEIEAPLLAEVGTVLVYGDQKTLDDLARRAPGKVVGYGPKTSLAVIGAEVDPEEVAAGLARDIALFDQRGCLSLAAVYTAGDAAALAHALGTALAALARDWPPGPGGLGELAGLQQLRLAAEVRGLARADLPAEAGTVVVEPEPAFRPSPGRRAVRVHPLLDLARLPAHLAPWRGRLQGAALAGREALALAPALSELGFSRFAPPGELQSPDVTWWNGGIDPLAALGGGLGESP